MVRLVGVMALVVGALLATGVVSAERAKAVPLAPNSLTISIMGGNPRTVAAGSPLPSLGCFCGPTIGFATFGFTSAVTFSASAALPAGVTLNDDGTSAVLAGTPTQGGTFTFTVTAAEGADTATSASFTLIVTGGDSGGQQEVVLPPELVELINQPATPATTQAPASSVPSTTQAPAEPSDPAGPVPVTTPVAGQAPSLVTAQDAPVLQQSPGGAAVLVDGAAVVAEVATVDAPAAAVAPEQRTPEQVAAIQQAGAALVAEFNEAAPDGVEPLVSVTNTDTGAVVNGVLVDPRDGVTPVPVPVEDVLVVSAPDTKVLFAASTDAGAPEEVTGGVLEVSEGGVVSAIAYGLPDGAAGEVVIFSTPTLLGSFTTGADGSFAGQVTLPELAPGAHTLVLTAGGVTSSLGLTVAAGGGALPTPVPSELPSTGGEPEVVLLVVAVMFMVSGVVLVSRRRLW